MGTRSVVEYWTCYLDTGAEHLPPPKPDPPLPRNTFIPNNNLYLKLHSGKSNKFANRAEFQSSGIFGNFFMPQLELNNNKYGCFYLFNGYYQHSLSTRLELGNVLGVQHADHRILSAQHTWEAVFFLSPFYPGSETFSLLSNVTPPVGESWERGNGSDRPSSTVAIKMMLIIQESLGHVTQWMCSILAWVSWWDQFPPW